MKSPESTEPKRDRSSALSHWDEERFAMLTRVIDAVTYDQAPGMRTIMVAEYLSRTSWKEISILMRKRRRVGTCASG